MSKNTQLRELADSHLACDLRTAENYLHATIDAHNLLLRVERLWNAKPLSPGDSPLLHRIRVHMREVWADALSLFDNAASRLDRSPKNYAHTVIAYKTVEAGYNACIVDAQMRMDHLKRGKTFIRGPRVDAVTAGFDVPDDHPDIKPFR
jgi:hypothetical protein